MAKCNYCHSETNAFVCQKEAWPGNGDYFAVDHALYYCTECHLHFSAPVSRETVDGMQRYFSARYNAQDRGRSYEELVSEIWPHRGQMSWVQACKATLRKLKWRSMRFAPNLAKWRSAEILQLVVLNRVKTLLDVGSSFGGFVKLAEQIGIESYCPEPSHDVVRLLNARGVSHISEGFFPQSTGSLARYDALTFIHVMFQFNNITPELFRRCRETLNPGGVVVVFCTDPRHFGNADLKPVMRSPVALNFTGERFMRGAAEDAGFSRYEYRACKAEPNCCPHLMAA